MPKRKKVKKKRFFSGIHLKAIVFLIVYSLLSKTIFLKSIATKDPLISFFGPYLFGIFAGMFLLYILNHDDFFSFAKDIERLEKKKERDLIKKYKHLGKILGTLVISALGGPIFAALTIRLLLNKAWYKYYLIALTNIASTVLTVSIGFSVMNFLW